MQSNLRAQAEIQAQRKKVCWFSGGCSGALVMCRAVLCLAGALLCQNRCETLAHMYLC
jgi:hypothetical protein